MESEARIMIDSKEGIIEIEGSVQFVERYLTRYAPTAKAEEAAPMPPVSKPRSSKKSCVKTLRVLIKEAFFAQDRSFSDIKSAFESKGMKCSDPSLRNALKELAGKRKLVVIGAGRGTKYSQPPVTAPEEIASGAVSDSVDIPFGTI